MSFNIFHKHPVSSNRKTYFSWGRTKVDILRLDRNYFYENSAVLLPVKADDDGKGIKPEDVVGTGAGVRSLAAVFKRAEEDNNRRIVIAGYADTDDQGGIPDRFNLSKRRAQSAVLLLLGYRYSWGEICAEAHQVKDYQHLLKYFYLRSYGAQNNIKLRCNPGKIDNIWGPITEGALRNFCWDYNKYFPEGKRLHAKVPSFAQTLPTSGIIRAAKNHDTHLCTKRELWKAFFDLYIYDICSKLGDSGISPTVLADKAKDLKFADVRRKFVACGNSFPLKNQNDDKKSKYEPEPGRGIEILFFDRKELPGITKRGVTRIGCATATDALHTAAECPIFYKYHLSAAYFDHRNLEVITYYMKFMYYDRIKDEFLAIPEGFNITAYHYEGKPEVKRPIDTVTDFYNGVYSVTVQADKARKNIYFEFDLTDPADAEKLKWVYTKDADTDPKIVTKKKTQLANLGYKDRQKYYDLPVKWCSENYYTRYDGDQDKGKAYQDVMKSKGYKPFGGKIVTSGKPLVFSLDDIVLVDKDGHQCINNTVDFDPKDLNKDGNAIKLSANSRITLFYIDQNDDYKLKILDERENHPYYSKIEFKKNLITKVPEQYKISRVVLFCSGFYSVFDKRTTQTAKYRRKKGHIIGARAAMLNDASVHVGNDSIHCNLNNGTVPAAMHDYVKTWCGNYEMHYLHHCGVATSNIDNAEKSLSYLIIYWHCRLKKKSTNSPTNNNWRKNWEKEGMTNSMTRTNRPYLIEKATGTKDVLMRMHHFYEAKSDKAGGKHKCLAEVTREDQDWMSTEEALFCENSYADQAGYYNGSDGGDGSHPDVDGRTYAPLMHHHEMGHATGCHDDYLYSLEDGGYTFSGLSKYDQHATAEGGPYSADTVATMYHCRNPRMRDFWHFVSWINDESGNVNGLRPFLSNSKYKMSYKYTDPNDGTDKVLQLDLRNANYRDTSTPCHRSDNFEFNPAAVARKGKANLLLYKTGGETSLTVDPKKLLTPGHTMNPRISFDAILIVHFKFAFAMTNDNYNWANSFSDSWMTDFIQRPLRQLNKFYLKGRDNGDFKYTLIQFVPYFKFYAGGAVDADAHHSIKVKFHYHPNPPMAHRRNIADLATGEIEVDNDVAENDLLARFFGKDPAGAIVKGDLEEVRDWLADQAGVAHNRFEIKEFA